MEPKEGQQTEQRRRKRPLWWKGVDGAEPRIPQSISEGENISFDGFMIEELFWNWKHNGSWVTGQVDSFISNGKSGSLALMKRWNANKEDWYNLQRDQTLVRIKWTSIASWDRYHDYLEKGGNRTVHEEFKAKYKEKTKGNCCDTGAPRRARARVAY
jgi:hypothetical protein